MVAPLVVTAAALAKQKLDESNDAIGNEYQAWRAYEREAKRHEYDVQASIAARRASRAGDAGYMQLAMSGSMDQPQFHPPPFSESGAGMKLARGLADQYDADQKENEAKGIKALSDANAARDAGAASGGSWSLGDDELLDPWG